jgi:hypothetical protein
MIKVEGGFLCILPLRSPRYDEVIVLMCMPTTLLLHLAERFVAIWIDVLQVPRQRHQQLSEFALLQPRLLLVSLRDVGIVRFDLEMHSCAVYAKAINKVHPVLECCQDLVTNNRHWERAQEGLWMKVVHTIVNVLGKNPLRRKTNYSWS